MSDLRAIAGSHERIDGFLDVSGRVVTMDAMHARHGTTRCLSARRAGSVVTAVRDNQETIHDDLRAIDVSDAPPHETVERGHGRIERRRCHGVGLSGAERDGCAARHGRRQAIRVKRGRMVIKTGGHSLEVTWCPTSPGAGPEELLELVRSHMVFGKSRARRSRFHLRRGPLQGVRPPPAAHSLLPDGRSHRHRALHRTLQVLARGKQAPRRPRPGGP